MAVWQFKIELIPRKWAEDNNYDISIFYSEEGCDPSVSWQSNHLTKDPATLINSLLPAAKSKYNDVKYWGDDKHSDASIFYEDGKVESITIRLDMRAGPSRLLPKIIGIASELDCVILLPNESKIIQANIFELNRAAKESNASKFLSDPEKFLKSLDTE